MKSRKAAGKVQQHAALRNDYVEMLVDFSLRKALSNLADMKVITEAVLPERHKEFKEVDASDVFDHYFRTTFVSSGLEVEFWGQTTCYKGNELGVAEANKTYEIRETLIEALTLRRHLLQKEEEFRVLHFTFGPSAYTYGWFEAAKASAFDWSMYSSNIAKDYDIYADLFSALHGCTSELDANERLERTLQGQPTELRAFMMTLIEKMQKWIADLPPRNTMADKQAQILNAEYQENEERLPLMIAASKAGGEDIKGRVITAIASAGSPDSLIGATLKRIYDGNGFISKALEALDDWKRWTRKIETRVDDELSLSEAINALWNMEGDHYVTRRLLVRLFSSEDVHYPADLDIAGVTEHTLYTVMYSPEINTQVIKYLHAKYQDAKITDVPTLKKLLFSPRAKQIVVDALKHDTSNGTNLKPSFYYLEEALKTFGFSLTTFEAAGLPLPVGYQTHFSDTATVQAYGNLKVVVSKTGQPIAIIKAKYFRRQEFPRRAKEEAYVGLTAKYDLEAGKFQSRYKLPFIMFVDMDEKLNPPEFALIRLAAAGWTPFFGVDALRRYLESIV